MREAIGEGSVGGVLSSNLSANSDDECDDSENPHPHGEASWVEKMITHKAFESVIGLLILANSITIGMHANGEWTWEPETYPTPTWVPVTEHIFTAIFTMDSRPDFASFACVLNVYEGLSGNA